MEQKIKHRFVEYKGELYQVVGIGAVAYVDSEVYGGLSEHKLSFELKMPTDRPVAVQSTSSYTISGDVVTTTSSRWIPVSTFHVPIEEVLEIDDPKVLEILNLLYG